MIFVTVGTHEQSFDRLIKNIDKLVEDNEIQEKVIIQKGYTSYCCKHCEEHQLLSIDEMNKYMREARIIITHGGPASFLEAIRFGKMPIVVPRKKEFDEHINNHQLEFCKFLEAKKFPIILVEDISDLKNKILSYKNGDCVINSNNGKFVELFEKEIETFVED